MELKKWVAIGALSLTALASGCVRPLRRDETSELRRYEQSHRSELYEHKCPSYALPQYCPRKH